MVWMATRTLWPVCCEFGCCVVLCGSVTLVVCCVVSRILVVNLDVASETFMQYCVVCVVCCVESDLCVVWKTHVICCAGLDCEW